MTSRHALALGVILAYLAATPALAHPYTFKGTVAAVKATEVRVNTLDDVTSKPIVKAFQIDKDTKILRGDAVVTFAAAGIRIGEPVSVTVNMDDGGDGYAEVIRLAVKK